MQRYKSTYTGPQIDSGVARALPGGEIDRLRPNRNLLDNWDFRNPVNQRVVTSKTDDGYWIDRWKIDGGINFSINSGYISLINTDGSGKIGQIFENPLDASKQYTLSVLLSDGTVFSGTGVPTASGASLMIGVESLYAYIYEANQFIIQSASHSGTTNVVAVKLELGSVSTLANDPPADFGAELAKCQRYFYKPTGEIDISGRTFTATQSFAQLYLPFAMRTTPAIVVTNLGSFYDSLGRHTVTGISVERFSGNAVRLPLTSSGMYAGQQPGILCDSLFSLSADL